MTSNLGIIQELSDKIGKLRMRKVSSLTEIIAPVNNSFGSVIIPTSGQSLSIIVISDKSDTI